MRSGKSSESHSTAMSKKSTRVSFRIFVLLFVVCLTIVGLKELPPAANSQALRPQKPAHVARELKRFEGALVYVLRGATADNKRHRLYFDRETGLLVRRVITTPTVLANIPEQIDFEDYREVDGLKLPFTIRITSIDPFFSSTRSFTEIKLNVPVDGAKFSRPAATPTAKP